MSDVILGFDSSGLTVGAAADGKTLAISPSGFRATYRYLASDFTPVATATDALVISGSASKVIRVVNITVGGTATAASIYDAYIVKRTTANTGGTATNPAATKADSNDSNATATLSLYSANPTIGTGTTFDGARIYLSAGSAPANAGTIKSFTYGNKGDKAMVLRGASESIAVNFNGQAVPAGASLYISVEWTEDAG